MKLLLGFNVEVLQNSCNTDTSVLPSLGIRVYVSGRTLVSVLLLINVQASCEYLCTYKLAS